MNVLATNGSIFKMKVIKFHVHTYLYSFIQLRIIYVVIMNKAVDLIN
jgi:hypothetical protein